MISSRIILILICEKPFFIYDPKYNLLFLFNSDFSLIKSTSVVDGKDAQQEIGRAHV
jgi:hypothetical protein